LSNSLFEINYVNKRDPFYQFGTLTTYTLECELFSYSNEEITTGISDIDTIEDDRKEYALKMFIGVTAQDPVYGYYYAGETLYQVSGISGAGATLANATATATLVEQTDGITYDILYLGNVSGTFVTGSGETIKGANSGAEFEVQQTTTTNVLIQKIQRIQPLLIKTTIFCNSKTQVKEFLTSQKQIHSRKVDINVWNRLKLLQ
jgi:hypothetical protein